MDVEVFKAGEESREGSVTHTEQILKLVTMPKRYRIIYSEPEKSRVLRISQ